MEKEGSNQPRFVPDNISFLPRHRDGVGGMGAGGGVGGWGMVSERERDIQMSPGFISPHQSLFPVQKCRVILMAGIGSSCLFLPNSKA